MYVLIPSLPYATCSTAPSRVARAITQELEQIFNFLCAEAARDAARGETPDVISEPTVPDDGVIFHESPTIEETELRARHPEP